MSKMVSDRARAARRVAQSARAHAESVGARLDAEFATAGVEAPPAGAMIESLGALITARADAMEAADRAHEAELADDVLPRDDRDAAFEALLVEFTGLRDVVAVVGGARLVKRLGLAGAAPRTADALLQAARMTRERLRVIPLPAARGVQIDADALIGAFDAGIEALAKALVAVDREAREAEATLQSKHQAMATYDQAFSGAAAALSALFVLADEPDLARRVRPSVRRPGRTAEEADGEAEAPEGAEGAEASEGAAPPPAAEGDGVPMRPLPTRDA